MDWMTLTVESIGIVIFCIWIFLPLREFREIFRRILPAAPVRSEKITSPRQADSPASLPKESPKGSPTGSLEEIAP